MKKVKVYCLNCYKKNEVETGVECTCPKCGSTFSLKEEATSDRANKLKDNRYNKFRSKNAFAIKFYRHFFFIS